MSHTETVINKLPTNIQKSINYYKSLYKRMQTEKNKYKINGYLLGLQDAGLISGSDMRILYIYMTL